MEWRHLRLKANLELSSPRYLMSLSSFLESELLKGFGNQKG